MDIKLLSADQIGQHYQVLHQLLKSCMEKNFMTPIPQAFYAAKLDDLRKYLKEDKAYLFAALDNGQMYGFLWACELLFINERKFHVLYFAVLPEMRGLGIGKALLQAAEGKARELRIPEMELIVSRENETAVKFYSKQQYETVRFIQQKILDKEH